MCKSFRAVRTLSIVLIAVALTACGKGDDKKTSTQIAAKVDDTEITMHEVNLLLQGVPNVTAENAPAIRKQVLDKLIDQQILVEKANKESLDRTPEVIVAMEAAKKEVLANAYLRKLIATSSKINDTEVKNYYKDHPALFSKRRIYTFDDIGLEKNDTVLATLKDNVAQQKTMPEIAQWLKDNSVKYSSGSYTRPAEQIPLTMLPKLQEAREGEIVIIEAGNSVHLIHIVKAENSPIDLAAATPFIKSFFVHTHGKEIVDSRMKQFRKEAKVEYTGEFAVANSKSPAAVPVTASTSTQVDTKAIAKEVESNASKQMSMDDGVAGLK